MGKAYLDDDAHGVVDLILESEAAREEETDESNGCLNGSVEKPQDVERREVAHRLLRRERCLWMRHRGGVV